MNILSELKLRFRKSLARFVDDPSELLEMIRPSQEAQFGDYQANCAMPLGKRLGRPPRDIAAQIVEGLDVLDLCTPPDVAGPGFINLRLRDEWIAGQLNTSARDLRLGVQRVLEPKTYVLDYSSPNVAKPMHVGHIRSTVIGDALCRTLRFLGHHVISDNHLGDWGTQFGMILFGFKHFADREAYARNAVDELGRLYRQVNGLVDYHAGKEELPELERRVVQKRADVEAEQRLPKPNAKLLRKHESQLAEAIEAHDERRRKIERAESDPQWMSLVCQHPQIPDSVLEETAKLHTGDAENLRLWKEFLPSCLSEIERIYDRLGIQFDHTYGESFYQGQLQAVVEDFLNKGLARASEGATCVFLDGYDTPMIIRKKDGAFLYATTDLATLRYRMERWRPDAILYVVDHRQAEHFGKLFQAARCWGYRDVELAHISFGTVLGEDGRPFKTRSGDTVGLESLLQEAVRRAYQVVSQSDEVRTDAEDLPERERQHIAEVVGIAALKYADLSQNRTSDYVFSYDKMLALNGNTATYMQYSYARVQGIFLRGRLDADALRCSSASISLVAPEERTLGLKLLGFAQALEDVVLDFRPNLLTNYLFDLTKIFFTFYEHCPVLKAESEALRDSRLLLCDLTARTIRQGLELLGIRVVDRM